MDHSWQVLEMCKKTTLEVGYIMYAFNTPNYRLQSSHTSWLVKMFSRLYFWKKGEGIFRISTLEHLLELTIGESEQSDSVKGPPEKRMGKV